ncbi:ABC transporter ATP-binding protein [Candidatus Poriferisodalis sp.]|uniref:ABC transporter ATP-binding protein n=1 Tax=Candidatus Poriferisodalis sp. TaxID=3101277 RepID=UPI003B025DC7
MIEIAELSVQFGGVRSLDEVTLTFPGGNCGLIGPNGAGKTTLFNVLSGFVTPVAGRVAVNGEDLLEMADYRRARWGVRRTFQTAQTIESLTVYENVRTVHEHAARDSRPEQQDAVDDVLAFVGLSGLRDQVVRSLSQRDRRFIEVARAIVGAPRVVLLDEPAAGLPDRETDQLAQIIRSVPERTGATVILVDHDMSLVQACCDWTAVLDFGRVVAAGPTAEVLRDDRVLAAYVGEDAT